MDKLFALLIVVAMATIAAVELTLLQWFIELLTK